MGKYIEGNGTRRTFVSLGRAGLDGVAIVRFGPDKGGFWGYLGLFSWGRLFCLACLLEWAMGGSHIPLLG